MNDDAVSRIFYQRYHHLVDPHDPTLSEAYKENIKDYSKELYLETKFILHAEKRLLRNLQDKLSNDYTKGSNNYTKNLIQ